MAGFTPGPWQISGVRSKFTCGHQRDMVAHDVGPDGDKVCAVWFEEQTGLGWADAKLIAAAPDLLEALKALRLQALQSTDMDHEWAVEALAMARAAISKATGEA